MGLINTVDSRYLELHGTNDKNVRVISSSRQPNSDVIGTCMTTVRLCSPKRGWKAHVYGNLNNTLEIQYIAVRYFAISSISRIVRGPQIYHDHKKKNK